jgi:cell division protein FtsB
MNNDNHSQNSEDEYHFPEDEFIQGEAPSKPQVDATLEDLEFQAQDARREKIMAIYQRVREVLSNRIVAAIVAVIILLLLVHWFTGSSSKKAAPTTTPVVQSTPQPVTSQPNPAVMSQLSGMKQSESAMRDQVNQMQSELTQLQASVNAITSRHGSSDTAIAALAQKVNSLQEKQEALIAAHAEQGGSVNKTFIKPVYYYLRAMVHNRAWLEGSNGLNSTVTIGSKIKGYGRVQSMDTANGKITMSTGKVITFPASDR